MSPLEAELAEARALDAVAGDALRELGLVHEATIIEHRGAVESALLWAADFRHCCAGYPGSAHQVDCDVAAALHALNLNFWHLTEVDRAWGEALHVRDFGGGR